MTENAAGPRVLSQPDATQSGRLRPDPPVMLKRALGLWLLVFYGLGTIVGAGIYVLVGEVAGKAGMATPLAFLLAGALAALTGLCYADLSGRFPEAAGASAYVSEGFGSPFLSRLVGFIVLVTGLIIAASLARGAAGYVETFFALPEPVIAGAFVIAFTAIACLGVRESVGIASVMTIVELGGLALVVTAAAPGLADLPQHWRELVPSTSAGWIGTGTGAFLAFFAFMGFESLANMGDEARDASRTLPRAILLAIVIATVAYVSVALVAVFAVPVETLAKSSAPLTLVAASSGWPIAEIMSVIALLAVPGGILIDVVMTSRLLYGMARRRLLPRWLGQVQRGSQVPLAATLVSGGLTFVLAVGVPFGGLVTATSSLTLLVFLAVNLSLWRLQRRDVGGRRIPAGFRAPRWVAPLAAILSLTLIAAEIGSRLLG